jgi:hypothetical protein
MDAKWMELLPRLYSPDAWQFGVIKSLTFVFVVLSLLAGIRAVLRRHFGLDKATIAAAVSKAQAELGFPYIRPRMERFSLFIMAGVHSLLALSVGLQWLRGVFLFATRTLTDVQRIGFIVILVVLALASRWMFASAERIRYQLKRPSA